MPSLKKKIILLIDDDDMLRDMYQLIFKEEGFDLLTATNGKNGLSMLKKMSELPDLILLDILMPKMSGYDVLKRLEKDSRIKKIPVVLLTNLSAPENETNYGKKLGAKGYLIKSEYTPQEILEEVKSYLK